MTLHVTVNSLHTRYHRGAASDSGSDFDDEFTANQTAQPNGNGSVSEPLEVGSDSGDDDDA